MTTETADLTPAQIVANEYNGFLDSDGLDPAWIAGWHAAINHAVHALRKPQCGCPVSGFGYRHHRYPCPRAGENEPMNYSPGATTD